MAPAMYKGKPITWVTNSTFGAVLEPHHHFYHIRDDNGTRIDILQSRTHYPLPLTIRDANDHSFYVEEGPYRDDFMSTTRWERAQSGKPTRFVGQSGGNMSLSAVYMTDCEAWRASLTCCVLYNCRLESVTLSSCHVHFTESFDATSCTFYNCKITTGPNAIVELNGWIVFNCSLKGNFVENDPGCSNLRRKNNKHAACTLAPYEVHNNIVLKQGVVDCLLRFIARWRILKAQRAIGAKFKAENPHFKSSTSSANKTRIDSRYNSPPTSPESDAQLELKKAYAKIRELDEQFKTWTARKQGKRKFEVNEAYDVDEQLEMPVRRMEWSVERTRRVSLKRRRVHEPEIVELSD